MSVYLIRCATGADLDAVLSLRREAERWLAENGIRQWTADYDEYAVGVLTAWIDSGAAWVVEDDGAVVATVSVHRLPDLDFWGWADPLDRAAALYLGKMIVARSHAGRGIGDAIMNWASRRAVAADLTWVRLDVRRDNLRLQGYYEERGFRHLRTWHAAGRRTESGWLAQRRAGTLTDTPAQLVEACPAGHRGSAAREG